MADLAVVGIQLKTDEVERGEKVVVKAFGNMAEARKKESAAATASASAEQQATRSVQETARALNSAGVSSLEFTRALRAQGSASAAVVAEINRQSAVQRENAAATIAAAKAHQQAAEAIKATDAVTTKATPGLKSLQTNLGGLAIAASGLPGPLGRTAQALSTFALGGGPAVAIIAGIAAIAYAYDQIEGPANRAREATDKYIASLREADRLKSGQNISDFRDELAGRLSRARAGLQQAQFGTTGDPSSGLGVNAAEVARFKGEIAGIEKDLGTLRTKFVERYLEQNKAATQVTGSVRATVAAQDDLGKAIERNIERINNLKLGILGKGENGLTPSVVNQGIGGLSYSNQVAQAGLDRVRGSALLVPPATVEATGKAVETRLSVAYDEAARGFQRGMTNAFEGLITGAPDIGKQLGSALVGGVAGVMSAGITDALSKAFKALPEATQEKLKEVAGVVGAGAVGAGVGYSSGSTGLGALSGAAAGSAFGPAGIAVGAVAGIVGGLLGSADKAKEAAARMEEARKAFGVSLKSFADEAYGTATTISRAIASAEKAGEDLKKQAPPPVLAGASKEDVQKFVKDLDLYVASLGKVDAATAAYVARLKDEETVRIQLIDLSLTEREAKLAGNDRAALEARAAREEAEVQRQVRNGEITQAIADRTSSVIQGELNKSIEDLGKAARDASAALAESLVTRELQSRVRMASTDAETQAIEAQIRAEQARLEVEKAVKDGVDAAVIANLQRVQALEDEATAMERARKAEEDRLRIVKESTAFLNDLKARELRATGQGAAADEYAQRQRDQDELVKAATFGTQYVMETLRVQGLERADRDAQRRAQQEAAYTDATASAFSTASLADSRTSVNLAVGTSESTTNRLVGVMQSQLVIAQQQLEYQRNLIYLPRIAAALDGGLVAVVDEGLAVAGSQADLGAGIVPGNR